MGDPRLTAAISVIVGCFALAAMTSHAGAQEPPISESAASPPVLAESAAAVFEDDNSDNADPDAGEPANRQAGQPSGQPGDGEADLGNDSPPLRDGIIDDREPAAPEDGGDPTIDMRDPEDRAAFENRDAAGDPLLFQIEDLDPLRDDRAVPRLFLQEPYDPVGIAIGSFVLFPEVEIGGGYASNVFRAPDARSDGFADIRPAVRLVSNWRNHALEFRSTGAFSTYNEYDSENDNSYLVEGRGRLDVTRRTNVQALLSHERGLESRSALDANAVGSRVEIETNRAEVALNQRFNRLSLQLRGSASDYRYGDSEYLGVETSNQDRDYDKTEETVRASWEFKPTLSVFAEVGVNQRDYDRPATSDGINRTSNGERYRAGLSFGNTGEILRGEIALGYGIQRPDSALLDNIDGVILDANASWRLSELTSLLFEARSDISETTTPDVGGAFYRSAGISIRHALRRHLILTAGINYATQDSGDGIIDERELRSALGVEYFVNRDVILFGDYTHTKFNAVGDLSDYNADDIRVGVRLRR